MLGRAGLDRAAQVRGVAARERRPAVPIASSACASLLPTWASPCSSAKRTTRRCQGLPRLVGLNVSRRVRMGRRVRVVEQAAQHPALGAERVRHERMGRDGQPARLVDREDRRPERAVRPDRPVEVQREEVAAEGRDLLADDDLGAQAAVARHRPRGDRRIDPLVVRDRDDVEVGRALDVVEDRLDAGGAVAGEGVDVEVGPPRGASRRPSSAAAGSVAVVGRAAARPPPRPRDPARSGRRPPTTGRGHRR